MTDDEEVISIDGIRADTLAEAKIIALVRLLRHPDAVRVVFGDDADMSAESSAMHQAAFAVIADGVETVHGGSDAQLTWLLGLPADDRVFEALSVATVLIAALVTGYLHIQATEQESE